MRHHDRGGRHHRGVKAGKSRRHSRFGGQYQGPVRDRHEGGADKAAAVLVGDGQRRKDHQHRYTEHGHTHGRLFRLERPGAVDGGGLDGGEPEAQHGHRDRRPQRRTGGGQLDTFGVQHRYRAHVAARYCTASSVSYMYASSSDTCCEVNSCRVIPLRAASSLTVVDAISLPRPMTTSRSAVLDISASRWLDTKTVRPSPASVRISVRTHRMPSGSSPLTGSSNRSTGGSPSSAAAMPRRWLMPSDSVAAFLAATVASPTMSSTSSTRFAGSRCVAAIQRRWARTDRLGWVCLASSSAPTCRSGSVNSRYGLPSMVAVPAVG